MLVFCSNYILETVQWELLRWCVNRHLSAIVGYCRVFSLRFQLYVTCKLNATYLLFICNESDWTFETDSSDNWCTTYAAPLSEIVHLKLILQKWSDSGISEIRWRVLLLCAFTKDFKGMYYLLNICSVERVLSFSIVIFTVEYCSRWLCKFCLTHRV